MDASEFPRPLNKPERDALNYLLATDFPGVEELREQPRVASVVGRCPCGCASVDFSVDREAARPATSYEPVPVDATTREIFPGGPFQLLIFVRDGWLNGLEITYYANEVTAEFPTLDLFEPPVTYPISA